MEKNHYAVMRKNILASMILVPIIPFYSGADHCLFIVPYRTEYDR